LNTAIGTFKTVLVGRQGFASHAALMDLAPGRRDLRKDVVVRMTEHLALPQGIVLSPAPTHGEVMHLAVEHGERGGSMVDQQLQAILAFLQRRGQGLCAPQGGVGVLDLVECGQPCLALFGEGRLKRLHGLNVLIVDYIGLMSGLDAKQPRAYQLEEISRGLKTLAKELDIAVVCLAQVNRKVEERADATPALSDLRDSGAIEQDADVVMFVHRPIQSKPDLGDEWTHYAKLSVAKNRQGRCGYLSLFYQGDQTRFDNWGGESPRAVNASPARRGFSATADEGF